MSKCHEGKPCSGECAKDCRCDFLEKKAATLGEAHRRLAAAREHERCCQKGKGDCQNKCNTCQVVSK